MDVTMMRGFIYCMAICQLISCTRKNIRPDRPIQGDDVPRRLTGQPVDVMVDGYQGGDGLPVASVEIKKYESKPTEFDDFGESFTLGRSGKKTLTELKSGETYFIAVKLFDVSGNVIGETQLGNLKCDALQFVAAQGISLKLPVCKASTPMAPDSGSTNIKIKIETPK